MTATAGMIAELRRLTAEPTTAVYTDDALKAKIEAYPLMDANHNEPDAVSWLPTYDLAAAASDVWMEKAAGLAGSLIFRLMVDRTAEVRRMKWRGRRRRRGRYW